MQRYDIAVIGGGIAGASVASALAPRRSVVILERESQPGYHSTGRSAAMLIESNGNAAIRALAIAGKSFMAAPPSGFSDAPILTPRGSLFVGSAQNRALVEKMYEDARGLSPAIRMIDAREALARCPVLQADACDSALLDDDATDIDVHALHTGYLRAARRLGAQLLLNASVDAIERKGTHWRLRAGNHELEAAIVINAAGAWADEVARLAGAQALGLEPRRRTAITFDAPTGTSVASWPVVFDIDWQWYFKPDAGRILASAADETLSPPCDAQPDEYDVALAVDRIERATTLQVRRIASKWAGLRSFVCDEVPVIGFDARADGFFHLAGQGGSGIKIAQGAAMAATGLIETGELPAELRALGLSRAQLAPGRLQA